MQFSGRGILLDIEGTTSSVSFVYDKMFPFVRRELARFLAENWETDELSDACDLIAKDTGVESAAAWFAAEASDSAEAQRQQVATEVIRLMDGDVKATGLKRLQGMIWKAGFSSRELVSHVYPDVVPALTEWREKGVELRIYSSGSIGAQKLFFGHTEHGDLLPMFASHFDTTIGSKRETESYQSIVGDFGIAAGEILFLSDVPAELDAARTAGMQTGLLIRPGNADVAPDHGHAELRSFAEIELVHVT